VLKLWSTITAAVERWAASLTRQADAIDEITDALRERAGLDDRQADAPALAAPERKRAKAGANGRGE
jgi:hypothetical protein